MLTNLLSWSGQESAAYKRLSEGNVFLIDRRVQRHSEHGDVSDMLAVGYYANSDGKIRLDYTCENYLDLEYYTGKLDGYQNVLTAVSNYIKGEIDLDTLLDAYDAVRKWYDIEAVLDDYTDLSYKDMGLPQINIKRIRKGIE